MKKVILIAGLMFLIISGCAGVRPAAVADFTIERVVEAQGFSKEQIFDGTKIWIAENFRSAKAVLEYESKDTGSIIGNGIIPYPCSGFECIGTDGWNVPFTMRVDIKDQRFRLTFSNIRLSWPPAPGRTSYDGPVGTQRAVDAIRPVLLRFGDQLLAALGKEKGKGNW